MLKKLNWNQAYSWWSLLSAVLKSLRADQEITARLADNLGVFGAWSGFLYRVERISKTNLTHGIIQRQAMA